MKLNYDYKVPSGKLLRLALDVEGETINSIQICGDFFIHPEDSICALEDSLKGVRLDKELMKEKLLVAVKENRIELFGLDEEAIAQAIINAVNGGSDE